MFNKSHSVLHFCVIDGLSGDKEPHYMYYVNDGIYGSFNCLVYDQIEIEPLLLKVRCRHTVVILLSDFVVE